MFMYVYVYLWKDERGIFFKFRCIKEECQFRMLLGQMMWAARLSRGDIQPEVAYIAQLYKNGRIIEDDYDMKDVVAM